MTHDKIDRNAKIHATKLTMLNSFNKKARQKAQEENNNPQVFVVGRGMQHKPSKRKSIKGSFGSKKKSNKRRGKVYVNIHIGLGKWLQEAESIYTSRKF